VDPFSLIWIYTNDWKRWEALRKQYPNFKLEVWPTTKIESYILQYQDNLAAEFPELFPRALIGESTLARIRKKNYELLSDNIFQRLRDYQLELQDDYPTYIMKLHYDLSGFKLSPFYEEAYEHLKQDLPKSIVKPEKLEALVARYNQSLQKFTEHKIAILVRNILSNIVPISYRGEDVHKRNCIFLPNILYVLRRYWFAQWDFDYRFENNQLCIEEYIIANITSTLKNRLIKEIDKLKKNTAISSQLSILKRKRKGLIQKNNALSTFINRFIIMQIQREQYNTLCKLCPK
jgi:hypothetical protein